MELRVFENPAALATAAARDAGRLLRRALAAQPVARLVAATGTSQLAFLEALCREPDIDWRRIELFHLDEYLALPRGHRASFRRYIEERLIQPTGIARAHLLDPEGDPRIWLPQVSRALAGATVDVAFTGIGENGHLAFNDPPADFDTEEPFLIVRLDEACRRQQVSEGWFDRLEDVPTRAVTMSVRRILMSKAILCLVSGARKRSAVAACLGEGIVRPSAPASKLREHSATTVYADCDAAAGLTAEQLARWTRS